MNTAPVTRSVTSSTWDDSAAAVSVVVATRNRAGFLPGLLAALATQTADVEVVVADDGSTDDTWARLEQLTATSPVPVCALRLEPTGGPSVPRNTAATRARAPALALTDDDCLPDPGWAAALAAVLRDVAVVQGRTVAVDAAHGPWDRTVAVVEPSGLYETCNLGVRRETFADLGGFRALDVLPTAARGFGEDVVLGVRAARAGGPAGHRTRWSGTDGSRRRTPGTSPACGASRGFPGWRASCRRWPTGWSPGPSSAGGRRGSTLRSPRRWRRRRPAVRRCCSRAHRGCATPSSGPGRGRADECRRGWPRRRWPTRSPSRPSPPGRGDTGGWCSDAERRALSSSSPSPR